MAAQRRTSLFAPRTHVGAPRTKMAEGSLPPNLPLTKMAAAGSLPRGFAWAGLRVVPHKDGGGAGPHSGLAPPPGFALTPEADAPLSPSSRRGGGTGAGAAKGRCCSRGPVGKQGRSLEEARGPLPRGAEQPPPSPPLWQGASERLLLRVAPCLSLQILPCRPLLLPPMSSAAPCQGPSGLEDGPKPAAPCSASR